MSLAVVLFAVVAAVTAVSALGVVLTRSIVRSAVWLLFTLIGVSLLYFLLGAEFLGAAQLIIYVGGTLVLVVFGVMLTTAGPFAGIRARPLEWAVGGVLAAALFALLVTLSLDLGARQSGPGDQPLPGVGPLGLTFLGMPEPSAAAPAPRGQAFLLPFEIVSIHLLVVLIAAAYLARAKRRSPPSPTVPTGAARD
jgi:NADH-quinone oxidoreductase subunit J